MAGKGPFIIIGKKGCSVRESNQLYVWDLDPLQLNLCVLLLAVGNRR